MILYIENLEDATRKLLELVNEFGKVIAYKINTQQSLPFLCTEKIRKRNQGNNPIYHCIKKKKILGNKPT